MKCEECEFYGIYRGCDEGGLCLCLRYPSYMRKQKADWCGEFSTREPAPQPAPQFDAEKVRYLIELYGHNRWQEGRQFGPNDNSVMSCDDFHNRAEYYGHRLLAALHIE